MPTQVVCPFCRAFFFIGEHHACVHEFLIDKGDKIAYSYKPGSPNVRRAVVDVVVTWEVA